MSRRAHNGLRAGLAIALSLVTVACAAGRSDPREGMLAVAEQQRARYCDEEVERHAESVLRSVRSVEPLYVSVRSGKNSYYSRLLGARLWIPARQGMTTQWLERTLRCYEADRTLRAGTAQPAAPDPFWLPESWVQIDVEPDRGGFVAVLRANTVSEGAQVYARAQAFTANAGSER